MERLAELFRKALPYLVLGIVGYIGERGSDGGFIKDVWTAAKTASPFAAMFAILAWLDEKRERRQAQEQIRALEEKRVLETAKNVAAMGSTAVGSERMSDSLMAVVTTIQQTSKDVSERLAVLTAVVKHQRKTRRKAKGSP